MADEISASISVRVVNGDFTDVVSPGTVEIDQVASGYAGGIVSVGTSEEDLAVGDVTSPGLLYLRNLDATNFVTYGPKSTNMVAFGKLMPGEFAFLRLDPTVTLRWKADTAAVKVETRLYQA